MFKIGVVLVAVLVGAAVLAPLLAPHDPLHGDLANNYLAPPGGRFLFGADAQGRDVLSRILFGARLSLLVGLISQCVAVTLGLSLGLVAGYYRGGVDLAIMRLADITLAFPSLLLLIAVAAAIRPSLPLIFVVIGAVGWAGMARLVRAQVLVLMSQRLRHRGARARRARSVDHDSPPDPQRPRRGDHHRNARHRGRDHGRSRAVVRGSRRPATDAELGRDGGRGARPDPGRAVGFGGARRCGRLAVLGFNLVGDGLREALDPLSRDRG